MAEYVHDPAIGSWFFQAVVASSKLDRMTKNARAAHWNKPRAVRYRESALIATTQTSDLEQTHRVFLAGVRVIQGTTTPSPAQAGSALVYEASDINRRSWIGEPQLLFPQGIGLPPFVERPVVTATMLGLEILKDSPEPSDPDTEIDADYSFVNWFGGLDLGSGTGTSPEGATYTVNALSGDDTFARCVVARPIVATHTGQAGASDVLIGLRFRLILGRMNGAYGLPVAAGPTKYQHPGAYYIHWQAMGPVAAY